MILEGKVSKPQQVIPRWMGYSKTIREGEFGRVTSSVRSNADLPADLLRELQEFRKDPHPRYAAYLFERLLVEDWRDQAKEVAKYLVTAKSISSITRAVAERMILEKH